MPFHAENTFSDDFDRAEIETIDKAPAFRHLAGMRAALRRAILLSAAALLPRLTARRLARRYLTTEQAMIEDVAARRDLYRVQPLGEGAAILRLPASSHRADGPRLLLAPGHDGHVRQFARVIRALHKRGAQVDFLVLPGHAQRGPGLCSLRQIVDALQLASDRNGPYDGLIAHCVSATGALHAMSRNVTFGRIAMISAPVDLPGLIRQGGQQYGLRGRCLDNFLGAVNELSAPCRIDARWHPFAAGRTEPALFVHARCDYAAPVDQVRSLARTWPAAQLAEFDNGGHNEILNVTSAIDRVASFMVPAAR